MNVCVRSSDAFVEIDKTRLETLHRQRLPDAMLKLAQHVPDRALLLNVQVIKGWDVAPGRDYDMTGRDGLLRRYSHRVIVDDPGVFGGRGTIWTIEQEIL
jgi:hypothetical protein